MKYIRHQGHLYRQAKLTTPDILWYEDKDGNKMDWSLEDSADGSGPLEPDGAAYQVSQFPSTLTTNHLYLLHEEDVAACPHPEKYIAPKLDGGWAPNIEGRECQQCGGYQTKDVSEPWPEEWQGYGSRDAFSFHAGWWEELALAMANDGYPLGDAILITAHLCGNCMNVMARHYLGEDEGYALDSEEYDGHGTECDFCEEVREEVSVEILQA